MQHHIWAELPSDQLSDAISRQLIHGDSITLSRLVLKTGAIVARHHHVNEQITNMLSGRVRFRFDDHEVEVAAGESLQIPSNVPHEVTALEDSVALDVFTPVREDWIRGEDAYLRGATHGST